MSIFRGVRIVLLEVDPGNELAHLLVATQELKQGDFAGVAEELDGLGADSFAAITGSILRAWALVCGRRCSGRPSTCWIAAPC